MPPRSTHSRMDKSRKRQAIWSHIGNPAPDWPCASCGGGFTRTWRASDKIDCDVLQADGGTRTASTAGAWVALAIAVESLMQKGLITTNPLTDQVAAISCGIYEGVPVLDLDYDEDSAAETDANFVLTSSGGMVEIQGTAEKTPFSRAELLSLLDLADGGCKTLFQIQLDAFNKARG